MSATSPLVAVDLSPMVEFRTLVLCDSDGMNLSPLGEAIAEDGRLLLAGPEAVLLSSAGNDFYPDVHLEVWDREPPAPPGNWELVDSASFSAPSLQISLTGVNGSEYADLPVPAVRLNLRAACRGRDQVADMYDQAFFHGVETWVIQIWPA